MLIEYVLRDLNQNLRGKFNFGYHHWITVTNFPILYIKPFKRG